MSGHLCWPRCPGCVREIALARDAARADLLPHIRTTETNPEEGTREPAAA